METQAPPSRFVEVLGLVGPFRRAKLVDTIPYPVVEVLCGCGQAQPLARLDREHFNTPVFWKVQLTAEIWREAHQPDIFFWHGRCDGCGTLVWAMKE